MSAGTQLQMAPQAGQMHLPHTTQPAGGTIHSQDSNMSTGSSHSDKEQDTPEKANSITRTPTERKRKRKIDDIGNSKQPTNMAVGGHPPPPPRSVADTKKINDYFTKHGSHPVSNPMRHGGAKSPSPGGPPAQGYSMVCVVFVLWRHINLYSSVCVSSFVYSVFSLLVQSDKCTSSPESCTTSGLRFHTSPT